MSSVGTESFSKWCDLPGELVVLILSMISVLSIHNFRAVCRSWRFYVRDYISSPSYRQLHQVPVLMLPREKKDDNSIRFFSLQDNKVFKRKNIPNEFHTRLCVGTSHGWLVMLATNLDTCLFNPFSLAEIPLPRLETSPNVCGNATLQHIISVQRLRGYFITKAVVSSNPSDNNGNFFVLMIVLDDYSNSQLVFFRSGDPHWMRLGEFDASYYDVVCHTDKFFALKDDNEVEIWDVLDSSPVTNTTVFPEYSRASLEPMDSLKNRRTTIRDYLVESSGVLFIVERYIGKKYVEIGVPTQGKDLYRTLYFQVYKLDLSTEKLEQVETLGDQVWFLGGNQSMSLSTEEIPACKPNSIYFSDDDWLEINEHLRYIRKSNSIPRTRARFGNEICKLINKCYDIGVFHMEDKSSKSFYQCDLQSEPPPFWIEAKALLDP